MKKRRYEKRGVLPWAPFLCGFSNKKPPFSGSLPASPINKPYLWPVLVIIAGVILIPYNMLHHGWNEIPLVWKVIELDPQQRQHFIMFNLIGVAELLISLKKVKGKLWQFVWPGALVIIGYTYTSAAWH